MGTAGAISEAATTGNHSTNGAVSRTMGGDTQGAMNTNNFLRNCTKGKRNGLVTRGSVLGKEEQL